MPTSDKTAIRFDGTPVDPSGFLRSLGLCRAAGKLTVGVPAVIDAVRAGEDPGKSEKTDAAVCVFAASDISENTRKKLSDKANTYGAVLTFLPVSGEELAHATGKTGNVGAVAVDGSNGDGRNLLRMLSGAWNGHKNPKTEK